MGIKARVKAASEHSRIYQKYEAAGKRIVCSHCGADDFESPPGLVSVFSGFTGGQGIRNVIGCCPCSSSRFWYRKFQRHEPDEFIPTASTGQSAERIPSGLPPPSTTGVRHNHRATARCLRLKSQPSSLPTTPGDFSVNSAVPLLASPATLAGTARASSKPSASRCATCPHTPR